MSPSLSLPRNQGHTQYQHQRPIAFKTPGGQRRKGTSGAQQGCGWELTPSSLGSLVREGGRKAGPNCASCDAVSHCNGEAKGRREGPFTGDSTQYLEQTSGPKSQRERAKRFQGATLCLLGLTLDVRRTRTVEAGTPKRWLPRAAHSSTDLGAELHS